MEIAAVQPQAVTDIVVKPKEKKNVSPIVQDVSIPFISRQKLRKQQSVLETLIFLRISQALSILVFVPLGLYFLI